MVEIKRRDGTRKFQHEPLSKGNPSWQKPSVTGGRLTPMLTKIFRESGKTWPDRADDTDICFPEKNDPLQNNINPPCFNTNEQLDGMGTMMNHV